MSIRMGVQSGDLISGTGIHSSAPSEILEWQNQKVYPE